MEKKYIILYCVCFFVISMAKSQSFDIYDDTIILNDVNYSTKESSESSFYQSSKSVKIENTVNELLDPIIKLNSSETLKLTFDILHTEAIICAYTFIHCDHNWNYSNIIQSEYLAGFFDNYIHTYEYSFNTLSPYVHYEVVFPNENIQFKKSGNYIALVYDSDSNTPILTKRFMVHEELLDISMTVKKPILAKDRDNKQEIDFYVEGHKQLNVIDPYNELKIIIQKNDNWNDIITNCKPSFINNKILEYDYQGSLSFLGGNEYRDFDIKSLRYLGKNIKSIEQKITQGNQIYYVELKEDRINNTEDYEFKYDLNGKYILSVSEIKSSDTEGDYALVRFTLSLEKLASKDIYIYGELTNWSILNEAKMIYNEKEKNYYGFLYLKQGYYNYQYIVPDSTKENIYPIEGEYSETRNQYSTYIYHTPLWSNYDRLIGVAKSTSNALN